MTESQDVSQISSASVDPFALFADWLQTAEASEPNDPTAMALASVGADGQPSVRMVLLKEFDEQGFVFYTNLESQKGTELLAHPKAALCFHWKSLGRQVRIEGETHQVEAAKADQYFASRPKDSQIGAWASQQSRPLPSRFGLEAAVAKWAAHYALSPVPRPPYWSGFRVVPHKIEFWRARPFRLHERRLFRLEGGFWQETGLFP